MCELLHRLHDLVQLVWGAGQFLSDAEVRTLAKLTVRFGVLFEWLACDAVSDGALLFHVTPKTHQMQHIPFQSSIINSARVQNYVEEGLVGRVCIMYKGAKNGPSTDSRLQFVVLRKYLLGIQLRLKGFA